MTFDEFYGKYYDEVFWYIFKKLKHRENAQDLAGDVFCACFKNYGKYDEQKSALKTWLYVIVNNRLKNYYRDKKIHVAYEDVENELITTSDDYMEKVIFVEEIRNILADAIASLPECNQSIVLLKYFGKKQSNEIAEILGMTPVNVRVIALRSLKKIHNYLLNKGYYGG